MKKAIIIGATSGIGQEVAKCLLLEGWKIGVAGRRQSSLENLQRAAPDQIQIQALDVTQEDASEKLNLLIDKLGGMDLFLLSSGIGFQNMDLNMEVELNTAHTNVAGFIRMVDTAFTYFKKNGGGHLAVISSIAGTKGLGVAPAYSATKRFQNTYIDALEQLSYLQKLYMKTKFSIIFMWLFTILFISCDKLDLYPEDSLSPTTYFKNENELQLYSNQFYYNILPTAADIYKDNADVLIVSPLDDEVTGQRIIPSTGGGWNWEALRSLNFLLENSHNCEDQDVRNKYDAITRFFRAYFYFKKVQRFGDVPWYDKVLDSSDAELLYKPRDSREFVMQKIIEDLDFAITTLSKEKELYRVSKWAALALKSRVCLFEGTFRKYHGIADYEKYLDACITASDDFMKNSGYSLYKTGSTPYQTLFSSLNAIQQEIVLARDYNGTLNIRHDVQGFENTASKGRPGLSKKIVNMYLNKNGSRFTDMQGYATKVFFDECQNRDPRLAQTIRTPGYIRPGETKQSGPNFSSAMTGYHLIKYSGATKYDVGDTSENDFPIFRTAEVFLNYVEAKAERGTLEQNDIDRTIKLIRDRVGMPNLNMSDANTDPDPYLLNVYPNVSETNKGVILEIRRERVIELLMEGFRYYDLMRWKAGSCMDDEFLGMYFPGPGNYDLNHDGTIDVCLYKGAKPGGVNALEYLEIGVTVELTEGESGNVICYKDVPRQWNEERDYLYPIPRQDRILTNGALTQNPGWNDNLNF